MREIKAPHNIDTDKTIKIFLAGSIDMGKAEKWQDRIVRELNNFNITILNPRRDDWDSSWKQDINNPQFKEQVDWELNAMGRADFILMYFDPNGQAPITLLELGLYANSSKLVVCCPDGYWRKGNVQIVCNKFGIPLYNDFDAFLEGVLLCLNTIKKL